MLVRSRSTRVSQPTGPVEIDTSNPSTLDLVSLPLFSAGAADSARQFTPALDSGVTEVAGIYGRALRGTTTASGFNLTAGVGLSGLVPASSQLTIMALIRVATTGSRRIFLADFNSGGTLESICMEQQAANTWRFYQADTGGSALASSGGTVTVGWHWVEFGWNGSTVQGVVDGVALSSAAATNPRRAGVDLRALRPGAVTSLGFDGDMAFLGVWKRNVPELERIQIRENPWALYRPADRRVWLSDVAGGGGGVTGSLNATEAGADTAAFSAASTASGGLAATETGSDIAAFSGQVTATGSLAATEVGSDTAAISGGNPAAIGSMAAQEAGSDTASIAGIAPATGTLTAQETGTDTASMAGASVVDGSLAATEVGSDSFFATSGAQQSVGTLTAQEVGSDTASAAVAVTAQGAFAATESGGDSAIMTGEARVMGLFAATETGQDIFSGTSIQLPARTGSMAATETGADGAALSGQSLVMGLFTAQEFGSDVFFASENDLTRIRPIQATYNTLAIDAGYNTIEIDPTYWID